jgi:type I restriction enzyme S subunit
VGIVPDSLDGALLTNDFPIFGADTTKLSVAYFGWLSKTGQFVELCRKASEGSTNRVRLKLERFLNSVVPLPPLAEQQRVVERLESQFQGLIEASDLRKGIRMATQSMLATHMRSESETRSTPMGELLKLRSPDVTVEPDTLYRFAGVYSLGRGVFRGAERAGTGFAYSRLTKLRLGDFVYPKLMAWEGAFGVVPRECDGLVVSPEFPVFEIDESRVLPEVIDLYFRSSSTWPRIAAASTGTNVRRRRLNPQEFLKLTFPLPPMTKQRRIRESVLAARQIQQLSEACSSLTELCRASLIKAAYPTV